MSEQEKERNNCLKRFCCGIEKREAREKEKKKKLAKKKIQLKPNSSESSEWVGRRDYEASDYFRN